MVVRGSARTRLAALLVTVTALATAAAAAQQRGAGVAQKVGPAGTRRALIVGISHYLYFATDKQLNYAAADAEAFDKVLRSPAGGSVADSNIKKLLNEDATAGRITADLGWLVRESKPGDEAIIYFAGHGDVESLTGLQGGFLLATDAPSSNYFAGGTIQVSVLGQFVAGITQKGASVFMITDACRSGKLIDEEGARRTTAALLEGWNGVTKLVSSSPDQSSWEGTQWGGGHGVFTYFLIAGIQGLADANGDGVVTLNELWRYVDENVEKETGGKQAPPPPFGDMTRRMARVDTATLMAARAMMSEHKPVELAARSAGGDSTPGDTSVARALEAFQAALNAGSLLEPAGVSAWDAYRRLAGLRGAARALPGVRENLAAAFQDDAQHVILDYLAGGNTQPSPARLRRAADEVGRARELLGPQDVLASSLKARQLFFQGYASVRDRHYREALAPLEQSVALEHNAAYAYNALGFAYIGLARYADARRAFADAQTRAPRWSYPAEGLALVNSKQGRRSEAETGFKQAIQEDSTYLAPRVELASLYKRTQRTADAERMLRDVLARDSTNPGAHAELASLLEHDGRLADAERDYRRAVALDTVDFSPANDLGAFLLNHSTRFAEAEVAFRQAARLAPDSALVAANLGLVYQKLGRPADAEREYRRAIQLDSLNGDRYATLGGFYFSERRLPEAEAAFKSGAAVAPKSARLAGFLGWTYRVERRLTDAEREYRRAIRLDSLNEGRYNDLGVVLFSEARFADAAAAFRRATALAPESPLFAGNLGLALLKSGAAADAEREYKRAATLDSLNFKRYEDLGVAYVRLGRHSDAEAAFHHAAQLAPQSADVAGDLGWLYAKLGRPADAEREYRRAMTLDTADFSRPNQLGVFLLNTGHYLDAETELRRATRLARLGADSADVADNLGLVYRKLDRPGDAEREFRLAITLDSLPYLYHLHFGTLLLDESRFSEAEAHLQRAAALAPQAADVSGELGWLYSKLGRSADAEREYRRALALDSLNFARPNELGVFLLNSGRYSEAEAQFRRAARLANRTADSVVVADNMGLLYGKSGRLADAEREFHRAIALQAQGDRDAHQIDAAGDLTRLRSKIDRPADVQREYRVDASKKEQDLESLRPAAGRSRVAELMPEGEVLLRQTARTAPTEIDSAEAADNMGAVYRKMDRPADAEREFRRAVRLDSLSYAYRLHLAEVLLDGTRYDSAAKEIRRAAALRPATEPPSPQWAGRTSELGAYYWKIGKPAHAEAIWRAALRFDSTSSVSLNRLAWALYARGVLPEAATLSDRSLAAPNLDSLSRREYFDTRANIWLDQGDPQRALQLFDSALALGDSPRLHLGRAMSLLELHRDKDAAAEYALAARAATPLTDLAHAHDVDRYSRKALARMKRLGAPGVVKP